MQCCSECWVFAESWIPAVFSRRFSSFSRFRLLGGLFPAVGASPWRRSGACHMCWFPPCLCYSLLLPVLFAPWTVCSVFLLPWRSVLGLHRLFPGAASVLLWGLVSCYALATCCLFVFLSFLLSCVAGCLFRNVFFLCLMLYCCFSLTWLRRWACLYCTYCLSGIPRQCHE